LQHHLTQDTSKPLTKITDRQPWLKDDIYQAMSDYNRKQFMTRYLKGPGKKAAQNKGFKHGTRKAKSPVIRLE
jgi:hypothetical protein